MNSEMKSTLTIGGVALAIVAIVFFILSGKDSSQAQPPAPSPTQAQSPAPAVEQPGAHSHGDGVPHQH